MRSIKLISLLLLVFLIGSMAHAQAPATGDGRINDLTALPRAAIYCQPHGIEAWELDQITGNGTLVLRVGSQILITPVDPVNAVVLGESNGYALTRFPGGGLTVTGPGAFQFSFNLDSECQINTTMSAGPAPTVRGVVIPQTTAAAAVGSIPVTTTTTQALVVPAGFQVSNSFGQPLPTPTQTLADISPARGYVVVGSEFLNLRTGDGTQFVSVAVLAFNTPLKVLGRNEDGSWWFVQVGNFTGWVNNDYVVVRGDLSGTPEVAVVRGVLEQPRVYIGYANNPVYFEPIYVSSEWLCNVPGNVEFPVIGRTEDNLWYQVQATCTDGRRVTAWIRTQNAVLRNFGLVEIPVTWTA